MFDITGFHYFAVNATAGLTGIRAFLRLLLFILLRFLWFGQYSISYSATATRVDVVQPRGGSLLELRIYPLVCIVPFHRDVALLRTLARSFIPPLR